MKLKERTGVIETLKRERDCYIYCLENSISRMQKGDHKGAKVYLENANRSLRVLEEANNV